MENSQKNLKKLATNYVERIINKQYHHKIYLYPYKLIKNPKLFFYALKMKPFFLLSYRKAGNTWLRGLLECYLNIGSKYYKIEHEHSIFKKGFPEKILKVHRWHEIKKNLPIIYIVRDPREILLSLYLWDKSSLKKDKDPYERLKTAGIDFFEKKSLDILQHVNKTKNSDCLIVKYEEIKSQKTWKNICNYLQIDYDEIKVNDCLDFVTKSRTKKYHSHAGKYIQKTSLPNNNKWKSFLTEDQINTIEGICKPIIKEYNYD